MVEKLKLNEALLLSRRRAGDGQARAARRHGVSLYRYRRWEAGVELDGIPRPRLGKIRAHERCLIARMRAGLTVAEFAKVAGVSRWWLIRMEAGQVPVDRLLAAWSRRGSRARSSSSKRGRRIA